MGPSTPATQGQTNTAAELAAAHEAMLKAPGLQFDFAAAPKPPPTPEWLRALLDMLNAAAPVLKYVFWGGLAVGVALLLFFVGRELLAVQFGWKRAGRKPSQTEWRPQPEEARALLEDADRLAAAGRFGEAAHLLLFRSIEDLSGRRPGAVRPALTARDIAQIEAMPPAARSAFGQIAAIVEKNFFGGMPVGREDFDACRAAYEGFALAEGWR